MSNLQAIETLCKLLQEACDLIHQQAELLSMHGIETEDGTIENARQAFLARIEREGWTA